MALSGREIMLVLRARDEASRTLRRLSRTMTAEQRAQHTRAMNSVRSQDALIRSMKDHQVQLVRSNQDATSRIQQQRLAIRKNMSDLQLEQQAANRAHRARMSNWSDEYAVLEHQRQQQVVLHKNRLQEIQDARDSGRITETRAQLQKDRALAEHRQAMQSITDQRRTLTEERRMLQRQQADVINGIHDRMNTQKAYDEQLQQSYQRQQIQHRGLMRSWEDERKKQQSIRDTQLANARRLEQIAQAKRDKAYAKMDMGGALTTIGVGTAFVGAAGLAGVSSMVKAEMQYRQEAAKTKTQIDQTGVSLRRIEKIGEDVGKKVPVAFDQIQTSLYDIFSSIDVNVPQAHKLLKRFAKDAVAGQTDMATATRANLAIMNAYKIKVKDASKVSDFMFQLVRKGVGTYEEFASTIGLSVPSAARAGQSYKQLGGMLAFLTRQGLSASRASTSAGRALDAISHPKTVQKLQQAGIKVRDLAGNFLPLDKIMQQLMDKTRKMSKPEYSNFMYNLLKGSGGTIQARRFFDQALKNQKNFNDYLNLTRKFYNDAGGAADKAYKIMAKTPEARIQQLKNLWQVIKQELGRYILPLVITVLGWFTKLLKWFDNLSPKTKKFIVWAGAIVSAFLLIGGAITAIVGLLMIAAGAFELAGGGIGIITGFLGPFLLVAAAVAAIAVLIYKNWNKIAPVFSAVGRVIKKFWTDYAQPALKGFWDFIKTEVAPGLKWFWNNVVSPIFGTIGTFIWNNVHKYVLPALIAVLDFLKKNLGPGIKLWWDITAKPVFKAIGWFLKTVVVPMVKMEFGEIQKIIDAVAKFLKNTWWPFVKPILMGLGRFLANTVIPAIKDFEQKASENFRRVADAARKYFSQQVMPHLHGFVAYLKQHVFPVLAQFASNAERHLKSVAGSVRKYLHDQVIPYLENFRAWLKVNLPTAAHDLGAAIYAVCRLIKISWDNVKKVVGPVFNWIGDKLGWLSNRMVPGLSAAWKAMTGQVDKSTRGQANPAMKAFMDVVNLLEKTVGRATAKIVSHFLGMPAGIQKAINKIIGFINGLIHGYNVVAKSIGAPPMKEFTKVGGPGGAKPSTNPFGGKGSGSRTKGGTFARGGVLPGYTPGRDVHKFVSPTGGRLDLSGGEAIMRPEWTKAVGRHGVAAMNHIARTKGVDGVKAMLGTVKQAFASGGLYRPVRGGSISQGIHDAYTGYPAIDISTHVGTPVFAGATGKVTRSYDIRGYEPRNRVQNGYRSYGKVIVINSGKFSTLYAHLSRRGVNAGQMVRGGQEIALSGNTGHSTGPHLHFGARGISPTAFLGGKSGILGKLAGVAAGLVGKGAVGFINVAKQVGKIKNLASAALNGVGRLGPGLLGQLGQHMVNNLRQTMIGNIKSAASSVAGNIAGAVTAKISGGSKGAEERYAFSLFKRYGWGASQRGSLIKLWNGESGWNPHIANPKSGAYGIPQALPPSKMASAGRDWRTNPATQIRWGLSYIKSVYGSPGAAYAKWLSRDPHWYDQGGWLKNNGVAINQSGKPEPVFTHKQWKLLKKGTETVQKFATGGTWDPRMHPRDPRTGHFISQVLAARLGIRYIRGHWVNTHHPYNANTYFHHAAKTSSSASNWIAQLHPRDPKTGRFISQAQAAKLGIKYVKGHWRDVGGAYNASKYFGQFSKATKSTAHTTAKQAAKWIAQAHPRDPKTGRFISQAMAAKEGIKYINGKWVDTNHPYSAKKYFSAANKAASAAKKAVKSKSIYNPRTHPRDPKTGHFISQVEAARRGIKYVNGKWKDVGGAYDAKKYFDQQKKIFDKQTKASQAGANAAKNNGKNADKHAKATLAQLKQLSRDIRDLPKYMRTPEHLTRMAAKDFGVKLTKKQVKRYSKKIAPEVHALNNVIEQLNKVNAQLDNAKQKLEDLKQARLDLIEQVSSGLKDFGSLASVGASLQQEQTDVFGNTLPAAKPTAANLLSGLQDKLQAIAQYGQDLQKLLQMGYSKAVYQQILDMGPEQGDLYAKALLQATPSQMQQINTTISGIDQMSSTIGTQAGDEMYNAGIQAAQGLIKGLQSQKDALVKAAQDISAAIVNALKSSMNVSGPKIPIPNRTTGTKTTSTTDPMLARIARLQKQGLDKSQIVAALTGTKDNSGGASKLTVQELKAIGFSDAFIASVKKASGGYVFGRGTSKSDSILARLSNGEYVMQAQAVKKYGRHFFDKLNSMHADQKALPPGLQGRSALPPGIAVHRMNTIDTMKEAIAAWRDAKSAAADIKTAAHDAKHGNYMRNRPSTPPGLMGRDTMPPGLVNRPVDPGRRGPASVTEVKQDITIHTQEIDPRRHAAELGWALAQRYRT